MPETTDTITETTQTETTEGAKKYRKGILYQVSPAELYPDPNQPRKFFEPDALGELQISITKLGVLQPMLVRRRPEGGFFLVSGERRYQAAIQAQLATVPVLLTDGDPMEVSLVENLLRENLTAVEEAEAVERLRSERAYSLPDLSAILGKAQSTLSEILSLNKLPETVKSDCRKEPKASRAILKQVAKQKTPEKMVAMYEKYKQSGQIRGELPSRPKSAQPQKRVFNLKYLETFLKTLNELDPTKLEPMQVTQLTEGLERLHQATGQKLDRLKAQPSSS